MPLVVFDPDVDGSSFGVEKSHKRLEEDPLLFGLFDGEIVVFELHEHALEWYFVPFLEVGLAAKALAVPHLYKIKTE